MITKKGWSDFTIILVVALICVCIITMAQPSNVRIVEKIVRVEVPVEKIVTVTKIVEVLVEVKPKVSTTVEKPKAPLDYQTFLFHLQVSMDKRHDIVYAQEKLKMLCGALKRVPGIKDAIPVKLYGVYLHEGKAYSEPLDSWIEEK